MTDSIILAIANTNLPNWLSWVVAAVALGVYGLSRAGARRGLISVGIEPTPVSRELARVAVMVIVVVGFVAYLNSYMGVPLVLVIVVALVTGTGWVLRSTVFGRHVFAVGGNSEAARRGGINVNAVRIAVLTISGAFAGLAGIINVSRTYAASATDGGGTILLEAIAAAVIGGTSLFGGRGAAYNALLGALVIGAVANGLNLLGQSAAVQQIATGVILVVAVSVDAIARRRTDRTLRRS